MRLPADAAHRLPVLGLAFAALAGCGLIGGGGDRPAANAGVSTAAAAATGPEADYPITLGEPFTIDGQLYTPADTLNYDSVGYAALDAGAGVTLAHRTLPLPSYVEVTSLATGKTILARVERRGPMAGSQLIALSPAAAAELGEGEGAAVRVRRVNPPEADRVELRAGRAAAPRIATPKSLVEVLRRKLPATGSASLRAPVSPRSAAAPASPGPTTARAPAVPPKPAPRASAGPAATAAPRVVGAYPLPPLAGGPKPGSPPVVVARAEPAPVAPAPPRAAAAPDRPRAGAAAEPAEGYVIQAGTFASAANAQRAAKALGGYVSPAGKLYRVRTGPFASRGQAEAALAKVRAAGYSDARVHTAG
ncbi:MAG: SPOR domain-containing protein [Cypionkella sp.]